MSFKQFLTERQEINLSIKAFKSLSHYARSAIEEWETANWDTGPLAKAVKDRNAIFDEIVAAFEPIRENLKKRHGERILLYRGMIKNPGYNKHKLLESWTTDLKVAEHFAGLRTAVEWRSVLYDVPTDADITRAVAQYRTKGYVKFRGKTYIRNKEYPEYYNIYRGKEFITDGDDLLAALKDDQEWLISRNRKVTDKAIILKEDVAVDRILWVTNNLNSKEFIVCKFPVV